MIAAILAHPFGSLALLVLIVLFVMFVMTFRRRQAALRPIFEAWKESEPVEIWHCPMCGCSWCECEPEPDDYQAWSGRGLADKL